MPKKTHIYKVDFCFFAVKPFVETQGFGTDPKNLVNGFSHRDPQQAVAERRCRKAKGGNHVHPVKKTNLIFL